MFDLTDINTIKMLMSRYGQVFQKSLGQNFLINPTVCPRMAEACGAKSGTGVLEIGPGIGVLTTELAETGAKVVSIELDRGLIPLLNETLDGYDNVKIINGDAMKLNLPELIHNEFGDMPVSVCANLPYYITSQVIMTLLEQRLDLTNITVMVQKEAAQRLCAPVGSRESGAITVAAEFYAEREQLFDVSSGSFMPRPKVDSRVIRLRPRIHPAANEVDNDMFFKVVKSGFGQRRKTLCNALSAGMGMDKKDIITAIKNAGFKESVRMEELDMKDIVTLCGQFKID